MGFLLMCPGAVKANRGATLKKWVCWLYWIVFCSVCFLGHANTTPAAVFLKVMPVILAVKPLWKIPLFTLITIFVSFVRYHNRDAGISMLSTAAGISTIPSLAVNKARSISILTVLLGAQHCFAFNVSLSGCCWGSTLTSLWWRPRENNLSLWQSHTNPTVWNM